MTEIPPENGHDWELLLTCSTYGDKEPYSYLCSKCNLEVHRNFDYNYLGYRWGAFYRLDFLEEIKYEVMANDGIISCDRYVEIKNIILMNEVLE